MNGPAIDGARTPVLIAMSGLPGAGKSTIARELGRALPAPVLAVDPAEAAMWRAGIDRRQPTGLAAYVVVEALAGEILALGQPVIVDAVNDAEAARGQWRELAERHRVPLRYIEIVCTDRALHRRRLATRERRIEGFTEPDWPSVEARRAGFDRWHESRLVLDSVDDLAGNLRRALAYVRGRS